MSECTKPKRKLNIECFGSLIASMQKIWEAQSRFVIFNGNQADLNALTYLADVLEDTEYEYLTEVFGKEFVWIFTPSTMAPLQTVSLTARDSIVMPEFTMFKRIPGLFGRHYDKYLLLSIFIQLKMLFRTIICCVLYKNEKLQTKLARKTSIIILNLSKKLPPAMYENFTIPCSLQYQL
ncbi:unnamed protein product [Rodentolepis nana]|uniref:Uncharacterized protein n=1 Tax=Rodentolepis nana TaxID=102285 RepID=A0A3P7V7B3_RODNA|nr:unnamed protein product [Rodentolepis nana]